MQQWRQFVVGIVVGSLLFVGLPIIAWGIADIQGFIAHPARVGYLVIGVFLQVLVAWYFPGAGRSGAKGEKLVRRQQIAVIVLQFVSLAMVILIPITDARGIAIIEIDAVRYLGLVLFAGGFLLMNWSAAILGKQFSTAVTIQAGHQLITEGPYAKIRHPRYLGIVIFNFGIALVFRSWIGVALTIALLITLMWRIHDEEVLLAGEFPSAWDAYRRQSWRLIPLVW